jgi:hypothetical protein
MRQLISALSVDTNDRKYYDKVDAHMKRYGGKGWSLVTVTERDLDDGLSTLHHFYWQMD